MRHSFLNLKATGIDFDESRQFREANDFSSGQVGNVAFAEKGKHVMFAEAVKIDVFDDDHFVRGRIKERIVQDGFRVLVIAAGEELERLRDAFGCALKAVAIRVFAEQFNLVPNQLP